MVAIEFSTWRSGRIGGASGSWTTGKDSAFALPGSWGKGRSLADQESIGGDAERGVVMESSPASPFELGEAEFALEFLIVAFDAPAQFEVSTSTSIGVSSGRVESQYLVGSRSPSGHSISNHSNGCGAVSFPSREAG